MINNKNKHGLSTVVATLLLVLLTVALVGIVWGVIKSITEDSLPNQGCLDMFEKLKFNYEYTCYNTTSKEMLISISEEDINISKAVVTIGYPGSSKSIEITETLSTVPYLRPYNGGASVILPGPNSGTTYIYNLSAAGFIGRPDSIKITPVIGKEQCATSDSFNEIDNCPLS